MSLQVTGEPNGIVLENAGIMMFERAMDPKVYNELRALNLEALKNGLYTLAQNGITSAVDARHEKNWSQ